jgi:putative flippase GtrA
LAEKRDFAAPVSRKLTDTCQVWPPAGHGKARREGARRVGGMSIGKPEWTARAAPARAAAGGADPLRRLAQRLPRSLRFLGVGALGLTTDFCVFTILMGYAPRPLLVRLVSLGVATLVTWRLNRALTFDDSGRHPGDEAARYALVTAVSQGTSYAVFAALVLTVSAGLPQAALVIGAVAGAVVGYNGHRLFAFAPRVAR